MKRSWKEYRKLDDKSIWCFFGCVLWAIGGVVSYSISSHFKNDFFLYTYRPAFVLAGYEFCRFFIFVYKKYKF